MRTKIFYFALSLVLLVFVGCSNDSGNGGNGDTMGRLTLQLTDAPFPFDMVAEANVTVFKVDARLVDSEDEDVEGDSEEDGYPFITLMEEEIPVNLLDLTNGVTEELADLDVPAGTYDLIRVYVKGVNVVLTDGRTFDLTVPSGSQTGIKVFFKPALTVAGGLSSDLLLDFDVSRSFVAKGSTIKVDGITGFNFKPVIKVCNLSTAGTLSGLVTTMDGETPVALENAQISIMNLDEEPITSGASDIDGAYAIMGLDAGTYKVYSSLNGYVNSDTLEVEIVAGNKTIQDFVLEAEAMEEGN
ncbi:DUF4382 domain-containing protein [Flagellimonas pelagia]|uniref:DUF4382 domain-containing protein n=1 Tax=Flagellimonas pelagia TaxID=2306998 RepID=A0A3A1NG59_9FLAO|nr:DUF4382 domain-containing protein [Allomuricauda maritima]RIV42194.1 DUF4382 domain-containing protein [Allomuricauda maritima]TXJ91084.1 DUF4382 domain-containing protein [Allomuricauda maritima]